MEKKTRFIVYSLGLAVLLVILTPLVLSLSTVVNFYTGSRILSVAVLPLYALSSGYLFSRIFDSFGSLKTIIAGVIGSTVFAGISGIQKVIYSSLNAISQSTSSIQSGSFSSIANTEAMVNPDLLFTIVIISFNSPIIYSLIDRNNLEPKHLVLYTLPVVIYLKIPAVFNGFI
ncbi:MAG: hypothetical protein ABEJ02_04860 [Candidatus Paceibacteria bacterium]